MSRRRRTRRRSRRRSSAPAPRRSVVDVSRRRATAVEETRYAADAPPPRRSLLMSRRRRTIRQARPGAVTASPGRAPARRLHPHGGAARAHAARRAAAAQGHCLRRPRSRIAAARAALRVHPRRGPGTPRRGGVSGRDARHANGGEGSSGTTRTPVFTEIRVVRTTTFTRCAAGRRRRARITLRSPRELYTTGACDWRSPRLPWPTSSYLHRLAVERKTWTRTTSTRHSNRAGCGRSSELSGRPTRRRRC